MKRPSWLTWQSVTRTLAVIGFLVASWAIFKGQTVPGGFFVLLVGLFFGTDVYSRLGPGDRERP